MRENNHTEESNSLRLDKGRSVLEKSIIFALLLLLGFAACKNISYPLLWNGEAETAMGSQRVINYGYLKVHNGINSIYVPENPMWLGYREKYDASAASVWGNYYFGAIGVKLAEFTQDVYQKTALIRLPFAIAAIIGLVIFAYAFSGFFNTTNSFRIFFASFLFLELLSVNLLLHIRQARYYSLIILATACFFYVFASFHFYRKYSRRKYLTLLLLLLLVSFNISYLTYVSIFVTVGLYQCISYLNFRWKLVRFVQPCSFKELLILTSPLYLSALLLIPELVFYQFFENASAASRYYHSDLMAYVNHLRGLLAVLCKFDLLPAMIIVKIFREGYYYFVKKNKLSLSENTKMLEAMEFFMLIFLAVLPVFAGRMPWLYTRYFIVLQPVIVLILLSNVFIILGYEAVLPQRKFFNSIRLSFLPLACFICLSDIALSENHFSDYIYQLSHPLKGPLDYYIPAIKEKFPHTENIVLATNYEEFSYEYYLGCNVIIGYGNKFRPISEKELQQYSPDVMIIRPFWKQSLMPYQYYLQHGNYQKVVFPVADRPVNDLPEMNFFMVHQFKTHIAETDDKKAYMYLKVQP